MNNNANNTGRSRKLVNWVTVWGFIFACIAFDLYVDNHQTRATKNQYQAQYEAENQRADSLYRETIRLEQHLQKVKTNTAQKTSDQSSKSLISGEL